MNKTEFEDQRRGESEGELVIHAGIYDWIILLNIICPTCFCGCFSDADSSLTAPLDEYNNY